MGELVKKNNSVKILKEGRYLQLLEKDRWEYVARKNCKGIVAILAVTDDKKVLFVEQYRVPVGKYVIELPAGLIDDGAGESNESLIDAAKRELFEETGYEAKTIEPVIDGPSSASSSVMLFLVRARGLKKNGAGGGDETESIVVHEVPLRKTDQWLDQKRQDGCLVDPKIYAGLYLIKKYN